MFPMNVVKNLHLHDPKTNSSSFFSPLACLLYVMIPQETLSALGEHTELSLDWQSWRGGVFRRYPGRHRIFIWIWLGWAGRLSLNIASNVRLWLRAQRIRASRGNTEEITATVTYVCTRQCVTIWIKFHLNLISCSSYGLLLKMRQWKEQFQTLCISVCTAGVFVIVKLKSGSVCILTLGKRTALCCD